MKLVPSLTGNCRFMTRNMCTMRSKPFGYPLRLVPTINRCLSFFWKELKVWARNLWTFLHNKFWNKTKIFQFLLLSGTYTHSLSLSLHTHKHTHVRYFCSLAAGKQKLLQQIFLGVLQTSECDRNFWSKCQNMCCFIGHTALSPSFPSSAVLSFSLCSDFDSFFNCLTF